MPPLPSLVRGGKVGGWSQAAARASTRFRSASSPPIANRNSDLLKLERGGALRAIVVAVVVVIFADAWFAVAAAAAAAAASSNEASILSTASSSDPHATPPSVTSRTTKSAAVVFNRGAAPAKSARWRCGSVNRVMPEEAHAESTRELESISFFYTCPTLSHRLKYPKIDKSPLPSQSDSVLKCTKLKHTVRPRETP